MTTTDCPKCHARNAANARFCQNCGQPFGPAADQAETWVDGRPDIPEPQHVVAPRPPEPAPLVPGNIPMHREHLIAVIDVSGSMGDWFNGSKIKLDGAKRAFISMVVEKFTIDPDDEVGIVEFDDRARIRHQVVPLRSHKRNVILTLQSLQVMGGTDINEGLKAARDLFDWSRRDVVRRIVLLTDGHGGHPLRTAEDLKSRGVVIDVIGVGDDPSNVDEKLLRKVASVVQGEVHYMFIKDQDALVRTFTDLGGKTQPGD